MEPADSIKTNQIKKNKIKKYACRRGVLQYAPTVGEIGNYYATRVCGSWINFNKISQQQKQKMPNNYNPKIHHRKSIRLKNYDYAQDGYYFVTICTENKIEYFGEIINGKMILNECGEIVADEWIKTKNIRKNVELDEFVVMPNHIHGIVIIDNNNRCRRGVLQYAPTMPHTFQSPSNNLGAIIRGFKSTVTKQINQIQVMAYRNTPLHFQWQKNYYDRVIRNKKELDKIRKYIFENPLKWELDRNNPENLFM